MTSQRPLREQVHHWRWVLLLLMQMAGAAELYSQSATAYTIDIAASRIYVVTHRTGLFSFLGHEHAILAREWSGTLCWARTAPLRGYGTITVATAALAIDTDSARAVAGLGRGPSANQVRELQEKMLDRDHLDAATYPRITVHVRQITAAADQQLVVKGELRVRDRTRAVEFPVQLTTLSDSMRFRGVLRVPQSGFGIRPESVAGVVRVADVVDIHFDLLGVVTGQSCSD